VRGAETAAGIGMEILVKPERPLPVRVLGKARVVAESGSPSMFIREKYTGQAGGELAGHFEQVQ
jgi:hypothetical protein